VLSIITENSPESIIVRLSSARLPSEHHVASIVGSA
jgi:hypothetical protein